MILDQHTEIYRLKNEEGVILYEVITTTTVWRCGGESVITSYQTETRAGESTWYYYMRGEPLGGGTGAGPGSWDPSQPHPRTNPEADHEAVEPYEM